MTFCVASNGVVHRESCVHARRIRVLCGGFQTVTDAKAMAREDFTGTIRVAPCAKA